MEAMILFNLIFDGTLKKLDPKYLDELKPTEYEKFRAISIYSLDDYYKIFRFKPNDLDISKKLLANFKDTIKEAVLLLRESYYPKDRILLIYALITYYVITSSNLDLEALENGLLKALGINKRAYLKKYTKGFYKLDLISNQFLDALARKITKYPGAIDYYKNAFRHKYYFMNFFYGSNSRFKGLILKIINKLFKHSFTNFSNELDHSEIFYNKLINESLNLINLFNEYLYFKKENLFFEYLNENKKQEEN